MSMGKNCIQLGSRMFSKRMLPFVCARLYSGEDKVVVARGPVSRDCGARGR